MAFLTPPIYLKSVASQPSTCACSIRTIKTPHPGRQLLLAKQPRSQPPIHFPRASLSIKSSIFSFLPQSSPVLSRTTTGFLLNVALYILARLVGQRVLTDAGLLHALYLGSLLWSTGGLSTYILCFTFLVVGSALTRLGRARKEAEGIAEKRGGARGPENLWGAAGVAALCSLLAALAHTVRIMIPSKSSIASLPSILLTAEKCLWCAYNGAIAAKFADTTSSEVGKAYGSTTFLITTWREVPRGTEGAVSLEGTVAGTIAAVLAAILGRTVGVIVTWRQVGVVALAGTLANFVESWIGATAQENYELTNEQVNFVNTLVGAVIAGVGALVVMAMTG